MKLKKTVKCKKCKSIIPLQFVSANFLENAKTFYLDFGYHCKKCNYSWCYSNSNQQFRHKISNIIKSIYCGHHSGFKFCCILWHALIYQQSSIKNGLVFKWYFNKYNKYKIGYVPCPFCLAKKNFVNSKKCPQNSHNFNFLKSNIINLHYIDL